MAHIPPFNPKKKTAFIEECDRLVRPQFPRTSALLICVANLDNHELSKHYFKIISAQPRNQWPDHLIELEQESSRPWAARMNRRQIMGSVAMALGGTGIAGNWLADDIFEDTRLLGNAEGGLAAYEWMVNDTPNTPPYQKLRDKLIIEGRKLRDQFTPTDKKELTQKIDEHCFIKSASGILAGESTGAGTYSALSIPPLTADWKRREASFKYVGIETYLQRGLADYTPPDQYREAELLYAPTPKLRKLLKSINDSDLLPKTAALLKEISKQKDEYFRQNFLDLVCKPPQKWNTQLEQMQCEIPEPQIQEGHVKGFMFAVGLSTTFISTLVDMAYSLKPGLIDTWKQSHGCTFASTLEQYISELPAQDVERKKRWINTAKELSEPDRPLTPETKHKLFETLLGIALGAGLFRISDTLAISAPPINQPLLMALAPKLSELETELTPKQHRQDLMDGLAIPHTGRSF